MYSGIFANVIFCSQLINENTKFNIWMSNNSPVGYGTETTFI